MKNPVFVLGTGRCGLTPLMRLIAYHPEFAWPTPYNSRWPKRYAVSLLSRVVDLPLLNSRAKYWRYMPKHDESYEFWRRHYLGFVEPFRDLVAEDVTPSVRRSIRTAVSEVTRYQGKKLFIGEYSGWSRIGFLDAIFPDARFIHLVRDGRAVANSYTNTAWWRGWHGVHRWRWGMPAPELMDLLDKYDHSFLALAAIHWKILVTNILEKSKALPEERLLLVRYEDLVKDPGETVNRCLSFLGLDEDSKRFRRHLSTVDIVDANSTSFRIQPWRENMSPDQVQMLDDILGEDLARFGYV